MLKKFLAAVVTAGMLTAGPVSAAQIDILDVSGAWTDTSPGARYVTIHGDNDNEIRWGTPPPNHYGRSGYRFDGYAPPAIPVNEGEQFWLGLFTHSNFPIYEPALESAELTIDTTLRIDGSTRTISSVFGFEHLETPNTGYYCCDDRVTFSPNEGKTESFTIGGIEYSVDISGFFDGYHLADEFWTKEHKKNYASLKGVIHANEVPEPGIVGLLALGIAGLTLRFRFRRSAHST